MIQGLVKGLLVKNYLMVEQTATIHETLKTYTNIGLKRFPKDVFNTKEKNVVYGEKTKFSFKKIFSVIKSNDQLVIFMIFAMLSNSGWYLTS